MIVSSSAIFASSDILATLTYYKDVLGFQASWTWGDPPSFGQVSWGSVEIMFNLQPELAAKVRGHEHWVKVEGVDEWYGLHQERGAKIVSPIEDKPWGVREYVVEDLDGYHLRFAGSPRGETRPSEPFPDGVRIERRMPTPEEHAKVASREFYHDGMPQRILETSWQGVVALNAEGEAIGTVRIMLDAPGWYSIWDVAVLPDWQGRHIGEAMMKEAMAAIGEVSPGAWVFLFTYKDGFYERLGFTKGTVHMRKA